MTKAEYHEYQEKVEARLKGLEAVSSGWSPACDECPESADYSERATNVSCDACGRWYAGLPGHAIIPGPNGLKDGEVIHLDLCMDCDYYLEMGQLDDTTMMEMKA